MTNYPYLLNKYENKNTNKRVKGEHTSNEYRNKQLLEAKRKNRHLILDELLNEIPFYLSKKQVSQIRHWIDLFNPHWKEFHRQAKDETILLALIFVQYKRVNTQMRINKFSICKKYNLTPVMFELIQNRLIFLQIDYTPLTYKVTDKYDHEILIK